MTIVSVLGGPGGVNNTDPHEWQKATFKRSNPPKKFDNIKKTKMATEHNTWIPVFIFFCA